jgi:hypothetical protein
MDSKTAHTLLKEQLDKADQQAKIASEKFDAIIREVPTGIPHPDGVKRIHNASREYSAARQSVMIAMHRLNDLVVYGIVPDDLEV